MFGRLKNWLKRPRPNVAEETIQRTFGVMPGVRSLNEDENEVLEQAIAALGESIVAHGFKSEGDDVLLVVDLRDAKYAKLKFNLSSLARKYRDGVTLDQLRDSFVSMLRQR